VLHLKNFLMQR